MGKPAAPRRVGDKEALAVGGQIRGSAQKLNLVAQLIRGRRVGVILSGGNIDMDVCRTVLGGETPRIG